MALRIITGRAGSGKTLLCLNEIKERLSGVCGKHGGRGGLDGNGERGGLDRYNGRGGLYYIVPEQSNLEAEHSMFAHCGADGLAGSTAAVLTFSRMSHRVFAELPGMNRQYINAPGKKICLSSVVEESRGELDYFKGLSGCAGFIDDLAAMFSEFKQYKISAAALSAAADIFYGKNTSLQLKLKELSLLYNRYCERVGGGAYADTEDDLTALAAVADESGLIRGAEFWIDGFDGFTEQEYDVLRGLVRHAAGVTVCLCCDGSAKAPLFAPTMETARRLEEIASESGAMASKISLQPKVSLQPLDINEVRLSAVDVHHVSLQPSHLPPAQPFPSHLQLELRHLERNLYHGYASMYKQANNAVFLREFADCYDEVEYAAASIRALCREQGYRYGDIAVICSDLEAYAPLVGPIFERGGIRCFIDIKKDITDHPLIRLILSLFAILDSGYALDPVFSYLKTGLAGVSTSDIDKLENFAIAHGIRGRLWRGDAEIWSGAAELNSVRERFIQPILRFEESTGAAHTGPEEFCAALYALLENSGAKDAVSNVLASIGQTPEDRAAYSEWKQIWDIVIEILDHIAETGDVAGRTPRNSPARGRSAYTNIFRSGAESYKVGAIPPSSDEVLVGSVDRTRQRNVKALFLLGANEGAFPGTRKAAALFNDSERVALRASGLKIANDSAAASIDSLFRVYRTLTIPSRRLSISWTATSPSGNAAKPSYIVKRLGRMFAPQDAAPEHATLKIYSRDNALEGLIREFKASRAAGLPPAPEWGAVHRWFMGRGDSALESIMQYFDYRKPWVRLPGSTAFNITRNISVSQLERYAACPFSYLGEYLVRALPRREHKIEAPDVGSFVHKAIEIASRGMSEPDSNISIDECRARSGEAVDWLLAEDKVSVFASNSRNRYQKDRVKDIVAWSIYAMSKHTAVGAYKPWKHEMRFSAEIEAAPVWHDITAAPAAPTESAASATFAEPATHAASVSPAAPDALAVPAGQPPLTIRGIVDRVDVANAGGRTYVRVVDYKTGHRRISICDIVNGLTLQLPVYLEAALNAASLGSNVGGGNPLPGGMFYFETRQPVINASKNGRAALYGGNAMQGARTIDSDARAAATPPAPDDALLDLMTMSGYIIGDEDDYENTYEKDIREIGASRIIKGVSVKRDGMFTARVFAPDLEDYALINRAVAMSINEICAGLGMGRFDVAPYKKSGRTPCGYCKYRGACGLDIIRQNEAFRKITRKSDKNYLMDLRDLQQGQSGSHGGDAGIK
ncbi:MAG: exodeoxyribonuclease V subunit gamma [Oscillospiraceae bacterium]|nr:exodeoxyribonuclease V subunit gamma [Oscillospiraceae bacterium]